MFENGNFSRIGQQNQTRSLLTYLTEIPKKKAFAKRHQDLREQLNNLKTNSKIFLLRKFLRPQQIFFEMQLHDHSPLQQN